MAGLHKYVKIGIVLFFLIFVNELALLIHGIRGNVYYSQAEAGIEAGDQDPRPSLDPLPTIVIDCIITSYSSTLNEREWVRDKTTIPFPTAIDQSGVDITATTNDSLNFTDPAVYTVTWNYDDGSGNITSQTQNIILQVVAHVGPDQLFQTIKQGLDAVTDGEKVKVAEGEYLEDSKITIKNGVSLEGGWDPNFTVRDPEVFKTRISGTSLIFQDTNNVSLDGFIIEKGNAGCIVDDTMTRFRPDISGQVGYCGGGIYCENSSPLISNCIIRYNRAYEAGGGIFCINASPTITNCIISKNNSGFLGGGICCLNSSPIISNSTISENMAINGSGLSCDDSSFPKVTNCTIWGNDASHEGGGICTQNSSLDILYCTFWGNTASHGGGIFSEKTLLTVNNSIFWQDTAEEIWCDANSDCTVTYSDIQGDYGDPNITHNIDEDPLFKDPNSWNFHLFSGLLSRSPCIDRGLNVDTPTDDKDGVSRPYDGDCDGEARADMGAYEYLDNQEPVPDCDPLPLILAENEVTLIPPTATDNCRGIISATTTQYTYTEVGTHLVIWAYDDENGNIGHQEQTVIIERALFVGPGQSYSNIQEAIDNADSGDTIKVASYTYFDTHIVIHEGIRLEGGWDSEFTQRDPALYPSELIGQGTDPVISFLDSNYAVIDGFIIKGSSAACSSGIRCLNSSPTISNCIISGNSTSYGGGVYCENSSPFIIQCLIKENTADNNGGGIYWSGSSRPTILNCIFFNNTVQGTPDHICKDQSSDIQLVKNGNFEKITILRYDGLTDVGTSSYRFFEKPCEADLFIQHDDIVVISLQP